ncbi:MAG: DUF1566 domain-containing protein [Thermodesulfobacteriota bacterium]|nr:DUF1566 domain-containing protein [Thermodesulfobacteriota bacterium]
MTKIKSITLLLILAFFILMPGLIQAGELDPPAGMDRTNKSTHAMSNVKGDDDQSSLALRTDSAGGKKSGLLTMCGPCKGTLSPGGRWCENGDGTVTDRRTGLVWLRDASCMGIKPWAEAIMSPIEELRSGDYNLSDGSVLGDWRLPTKAEFLGIMKGKEAVNSSNMQLFKRVQADYYWSATTDHRVRTTAWFVRMVNGYMSVDDKMYNANYIWPVRSSNSGR